MSNESYENIGWGYSACYCYDKSAFYYGKNEKLSTQNILTNHSKLYAGYNAEKIEKWQGNDILEKKSKFLHTSGVSFFFHSAAHKI